MEKKTKHKQPNDGKTATHEPNTRYYKFACKAVAALMIKKILFVEICCVAFGS